MTSFAPLVPSLSFSCVCPESPKEMKYPPPTHTRAKPVPFGVCISWQWVRTSRVPTTGGRAPLWNPKRRPARRVGRRRPRERRMDPGSVPATRQPRGGAPLGVSRVYPWRKGITLTTPAPRPVRSFTTSPHPPECASGASIGRNLAGLTLHKVLRAGRASPPTPSGSWNITQVDLVRPPPLL